MIELDALDHALREELLSARVAAGAVKRTARSRSVGTLTFDELVTAGVAPPKLRDAKSSAYHWLGG